MKMAFWSLFVVGFVACSTFGIGPVLKRVGGDWMSPPMLAGIVLGIAIVLLAGLFVAGVRPTVLPTDTAMIVALLALVGAKVAVGALTMSGVLPRG